MNQNIMSTCLIRYWYIRFPKSSIDLQKLFLQSGAKMLTAGSLTEATHPIKLRPGKFSNISVILMKPFLYKSCNVVRYFALLKDATLIIQDWCLKWDMCYMTMYPQTEYDTRPDLKVPNFKLTSYQELNLAPLILIEGRVAASWDSSMELDIS